jgi:hypothetical protein
MKSRWCSPVWCRSRSVPGRHYSVAEHQRPRMWRLFEGWMRKLRRSESQQPSERWLASAASEFSEMFVKWSGACTNPSQTRFWFVDPDYKGAWFVFSDLVFLSPSVPNWSELL